MIVEFHDHRRFVPSTLIAKIDMDFIPRKGETVKIGEEPLVVGKVQYYFPSEYQPRKRVVGGFEPSTFRQIGPPVVQVYVRPIGATNC